LEGNPPNAPTMEFHVARKARDRYEFDQSIYSITGNVIIANFHAARQFAHRMNQKRDLVAFPEQAVKASQVNAMALIHELTHYMFRVYREQVNPRLLEETLGFLERQIGRSALDKALVTFSNEFPPLAVYQGEQSVESYLAASSEGVPNRQIVLEEMLMLWLENSNPAFAPFAELFDDLTLENQTSYPTIMNNVYSFFGGVAKDAAEGLGGSSLAGVFGAQNLIDILRAPALASPHSLEGQLEFIRGRWGVSLASYIYRLLGSLDLIKEETKPVFFGPGPVESPTGGFAELDVEDERFSADLHWMPRMILLAKNAYVWLDQLSKAYQRPIHTLDQVPDEELDKLQRWGITGLWLIGLWERSVASARIKQIMGNSDAVASAYSLYDYQIAQKLGGESAAQNLRERAWKRGIRLSSDMVPNHVGIDGRWVLENPEWFISLDYPPYPSYTFNGPNLANHERIGIYLEDHYYDRSDASVVFKRVDHWTGETKYIYHGNDGTSMPWNDTAQLDYLNPAVREVVIQTILHVARQFPVIRFDAAMTLAKRHIQRLWYPEPGSGGAIASRSEHAISRADFEAAIPVEFWREVVDRVAAEVPDTLLLAEAFWMMEGYFVRTLGMHRVYNSAFMHMTRDEDNAKYRGLMKETLEFDPEILKRYVNFQSNPDERTAIDQYGKEDKYFGVCTLMLTLPGLPMIGHGQVEGFAEKYGMEYQRSYWNEEPDQHLIARHEREIFPLMHKRYLFAEVANFTLYDFYSAEGGVNEDVFTYSNRYENERGLVFYHNRFASARGWIKHSAAFALKTGQGDERHLVQRTLAEALDLRGDDGIFYVFRDHTGGLEYIRRGRDLVEQGMYVELEAYKCHTFIDWRELKDDALGTYEQLHNELSGRGVPSISEALKGIFLRPIHTTFKQLLNPAQIERFQQSDPEQRELHYQELQADLNAFLEEIKLFVGSEGKVEPLVREIIVSLRAVQALQAAPSASQADSDDDASDQVLDPAQTASFYAWALIHPIGKLSDELEYAEQSRSWLDEWSLGRILSSVVGELGADSAVAQRAVGTLQQLVSQQNWLSQLEADQPAELLGLLLSDDAIHHLLQVNRYNDLLWFNKDAFEHLLNALVQLAQLTSDQADPAALQEGQRQVSALQKAAEQAGYQLEKLIASLEKPKAL
jgi:glycosidase